MIQRDELLAMFERSGALLEGHFVLSSGLHSTRYLQCARVLEDPRRAERLGSALYSVFAAAVDTVLSPALGGVIIGHEVARAAKVRFLFTERDSEGRAVLRRGFNLRAGERVLVVEDVVTTGLSTREVIELARAAGAGVLAVAAIVDRSGGKAAFDVPFHSLLQLDVPALPPERCDLCRQRIPAEKPGSRKSR